MHILLLSVTFYPEENARANRWKAIAFEMAAKGHAVWVLCRRAPDCPDSMHVNGVTIIRTGHIPLGAQYRKTQRTTRKQPAKLFNILLYLRSQTWKKIWWPDSSLTWWWPAIRKATLLIPALNITALYTISLPFVAHLVGMHLKKRFPNLYWIADHGDPFSIRGVLPQNNHRLFHRLNRFAEKKVLQQADCNFVNTPALETYYRKLAVGCHVKIVPHVLPNIPPTRTIPTFSEPRITIDYFGTLIPQNRSAQAFFDFLHFFLQVYPHWQPYIDLRFFGSGIIPQEGRYIANLPHEEALQAIQHAHILLSLGYNSPYMLPMKLMEYLASGRPILHIVQHPEDPALDLLHDFPTCYTIDLSDTYHYPECVLRLNTLLETYQSNTLSDVQLIKAHALYSPSAVSARYLNAIKVP